MIVKEDWEKKLIQEARKLTKHGWGEMVFLAYTNEKGHQKIVVKAGKSWIFTTNLIDKK